MNSTSSPSAPCLSDISNYTINNPQIQNSIQQSQSNLSKFDLLVKQRELNPKVADQLKDILSTCEVVLLCDDSDSMSLTIAEEGTDPFAPRNSTRWLELKKLAAVIIQFVTAVNDSGLDLYFLNRQKVCNINSLAGLQNIFNVPPNGGTNLTNSLMEIYEDKKHVTKHKKLLIVVITDGEPTDGTGNARDNLYRAINYIVSNSHDNTHISFAECTDNAEDMEYLDRWDGLLRNFDNTDDYREELMRVKSIQGMQFKFDYTDYVIKILLATFVRWYFNLDQSKVSSTDYNNYQSNQSPNTQTQLYQPQIYQPPTNVQSYNPNNTQSSYPNTQQMNQPTNGNINQNGGCCIIL